MTGYNLTKYLDRVRQLADYTAELHALDVGTWPRDINDSMRWTTTDTVRIKRILRDGIAYIYDVERRLQADDPDLAGWERSPCDKILSAEGVPVPTKLATLWWQEKGLSFTRTGYGRRIPTRYMVLLPGSPRWRRVYCCIFSNSGTCYVDGPRDTNGKRPWIVVRD